MSESWHFGNAAKDAQGKMEARVRQLQATLGQAVIVEIKWGVHPSGDERADWQGDESRTTVLLLVKGRFRISLSVDSFVLEQEGDYAMWGPGIGHSWHAEEDTVVITVRWPSTSAK